MRGAGCIYDSVKEYGRFKVAVPVRGAGCITAKQGEKFTLNVAVPVRGAGCIDANSCYYTLQGTLLSP